MYEMLQIQSKFAKFLEVCHIMSYKIEKLAIDPPPPPTIKGRRVIPLLNFTQFKIFIID